MADKEPVDVSTWAYHKSCPDGRLFKSPADVPSGWVDTPAKLKPADEKKDKD